MFKRSIFMGALFPPVSAPTFEVSVSKGSETLTVRMPDGRIITGLPRDLTQEEFLDLYNRSLPVQPR